MLNLTRDEADEADAQFTGFYQAAALAEASMLVDRNDRGWFGTPQERHQATSALVEALAAFVMSDEQ